MSDQNQAPWQAKIASTVLSQLGLGLAQVLAYLDHSGRTTMIAIAVLQAIQGSVASYGLGTWRAAGRAILDVGQAVSRARRREPEGGPGPGGPTP